MHQGAVRALDLKPVSSEIKGHAGAFIFATRDELHAGVQAVYRISVCLPNFPLEKYSQAVAGVGDTEAERMQKYRIGQEIFRDALLEYWESRCPLTGITSPDLLKSSHIMPWSHCKTDAQRLDVYNGLLLSALWDAAFDAGMVSFDDDGTILASARLDGAAREALALKDVSRLALRDEHRAYMTYHRSQIWTPG
jgi:predicted restriction endonuclease